MKKFAFFAFCCFLALSTSFFQQEKISVADDSVETSSNWDVGRIKERRVIDVDGVEYAFRFCPAGTYTIGSPDNELGRDPDETRHEVVLSHPYWILETEVTQEMWQGIMGENPSWFKGENLPVETVSWNDCQKFIEKLNAKGVAPEGWVFSLPTETEWEVAARAGAETSYPWGNSWDESMANGWNGGAHEPTNVGSYPANAWGIFDMSGNVFEWCLDAYGMYPDTVETDPLGKDNAKRVFRCGSWSAIPRLSRVSYRLQFAPTYKMSDLGFRIVLASDAVRER